MNREIKFRAWDGSRIFNVARYDFADNTVYSHLFACEGYLGEKLEIMQYTGLQDENGTEIYEGDIVKCFTNGNSYVSFKGGVYGLIFDYTFIPFSDIHGEMRVIGNIYENPELLEESK